MKAKTISLRSFFVVFTILLLVACVAGKKSYERHLAEVEYDRIEKSLLKAIDFLGSGQISAGLSVGNYLNLVTPNERINCGQFTVFRHGFCGGLGHGCTIIANDGSLAKAYTWSCCGGDTFFNSLTPLEERQLENHFELARE